MDLFSRKIIAWTLSHTLETVHVIETINKAKRSRKLDKPLIFDYIEAFYNTVRIHNHCGYLSPEEYEKENEHNLNEMKKRTG